MNIALMLSGGTGSRMGGDTPKQYIPVAGKPILLYSLETIACHKGIDMVQIVADPFWQKRIVEWIGEEAQSLGGKLRGFSLPGENRQLSVLNGLRDICRYASGEAFVLIHDAARPLLSGRQVDDCLDAVKRHDGVLPVLSMKDTVYYSEDGKSVSLLERDRIFAGQAPEVFRLGPYLEANERLLPEKIRSVSGSTEPAVLAGLDVVMIPGDERNFKITTKEDLERFRQILMGGQK